MSIKKDITPQSLLTLLQLVDSFFPIGAFAHSFGLETYVQQGLVTDRSTFEALLRASLYQSVQRTDAVAVALAYRIAQTSGEVQEEEPVYGKNPGGAQPTHSERWKQIVDLDARLTALKLPREPRLGSIQIGKQFLRNARKLFTSEVMTVYARQIESRICTGHHSIAYGITAAAASINLVATLTGYLHSYVTGQVSAAVRLIPLGATEGQLVIQAIGPDLLKIVALVQEARIEDLGSFAPALDIRSMQHEHLYSRLFIS